MRRFFSTLLFSLSFLSRVGFVTVGLPLGLQPVPSFDVFDSLSSKTITTSRKSQIGLVGAEDVRVEKVEELKHFHLSVFKHLLPHLSVSDWAWSDAETRNYLVAPLKKVSAEQQEWTVEWESITPWWESSSAALPGVGLDWRSQTREQFEKLISESILLSETNHQSFVGTEVRWDITPDSKWPFEVPFALPKDVDSADPSHSKPKRIASNGEFYTYRDHVRDRWNVDLKPGDQPTIVFRPFTFRAGNVLSPLTPATANEHLGTPHTTPTKRGNEMQFQLFADLCRRLPISVSEFNIFRFLPSIFIRLEALLKASHLIFNVVGLERPADPLSLCQLINHVLEAITAPSCTEAFNFEQLETVGDCFLKWISCLDTFHRRPLFHDRQLDIVKHAFVANRTLYDKSVKWNLGCFLNTRHCKIENWVPPGVRMPEYAPLPSVCQ